MDTEHQTTQGQITTRLAYREGLLCVLVERGFTRDSQPTRANLWYPIRAAEEAEVRTLLGRSLTEVDAKEGIYVDEEGTVYQLSDKGETEPMAVEEISGEGAELEQLLAASIKDGNSSQQARTHALLRSTGRGRKKGVREKKEDTRPNNEPPCGGVIRDHPVVSVTQVLDHRHDLVQMNLRQKLAEVRRRLGYVQKRGFNERNNYSYVTAADLAGAVGDILAELGVVIVPRLESITYEPNPSGRAEVRWRGQRRWSWPTPSPTSIPATRSPPKSPARDWMRETRLPTRR